MKPLLIIFIVICPFVALSQVEHNFKMNPANTDCHKLPATFESQEEAFKAVESSKFRIQQSMKISRFRSPRSATFYSCDGEKGYLIARETDEKRVIYPDIPKTVWDEFMGSKDPIYFYEKEIKGAFEGLSN